MPSPQFRDYLSGFADKSAGEVLTPRPRPRQRKANEPTFGARELLFRMAGVDLTVTERQKANNS